MDQKPDQYVEFSIILIYPNEPFVEPLVASNLEIPIIENDEVSYLPNDSLHDFVNAISALLDNFGKSVDGFTHLELEAICYDEDDMPNRFFSVGKWICQNKKVLLKVDDRITNFEMTGELLEKIADRLLKGEEYSPIEPYGEAMDRLIDMQPNALEDYYGEEIEFDEIWELLKVKEIEDTKNYWLW